MGTSAVLQMCPNTWNLNQSLSVSLLLCTCLGGGSPPCFWRWKAQRWEEVIEAHASSCFSFIFVEVCQEYCVKLRPILSTKCLDRRVELVIVYLSPLSTWRAFPGGARSTLTAFQRLVTHEGSRTLTVNMLANWLLLHTHSFTLKDSPGVRLWYRFTHLNWSLCQCACKNDFLTVVPLLENVRLVWLKNIPLYPQL